MARDITSSMSLEEIDAIARDVYGSDYEAIGKHVVGPIFQTFFGLSDEEEKMARHRLNDIARESLRGKPAYQELIARILDEYGLKINRSLV